MFTDEHRRKVWDDIRQYDLRAFGELLPTGVFLEAAKHAGVKLGKSALWLPNLVMLGVASALHSTRCFADILVFTLKLLEDSEQWGQTPLATARRNAQRGSQRRKGRKRDSKHSPKGKDPTQITEEAFVQARRRMPLAFWTGLLFILSQRFITQHGHWLKWNDFRLLALDGTKVNLPNWKALRDYFGSAKNGQGKASSFRAQAHLVMLQFPLARLPFRYELASLAEGERTVAGRLLRGLTPNDLVLMDQGFWSYGLFWQIQNQQAFFAVRLFPGVKFRTIKKLGRKDRLVEWSPADHQWRRAKLPTSIRLRVINYQVKGFRPTAVVTNVLSPRRVPREAWIHLATKDEEGRLRLAQGLYHRRWEIETTFKELKVSQGMEGHLRCRTPEGIAYEVAGHVLLYFLIRWLIVIAAEEAGADPLCISFQHALHELLDMVPSLTTTSPQRVSRVLLPRLLARIATHRVPFRPGRSYQRPGDKAKNYGHGKIRVPHKLQTKSAET
jgi:hypothetical protein